MTRKSIFNKGIVLKEREDTAKDVFAIYSKERDELERWGGSYFSPHFDALQYAKQRSSPAAFKAAKLEEYDPHEGHKDYRDA